MTSLLLLIFSFSLICFHGKSQSVKYQEPEFECVDIYNQPSLHHPRLQNHQIQKTPSDEVLAMLSRETTSQNLLNDEAIAEFDIPEKGCPKGQVPIHKPRNFNYTAKPFHSISNGNRTIGQHVAGIRKIEAIPWRGASAWISVYQPKVHKGQFSMALIGLKTENNCKLNTIQFGWAVDPGLYGDNLPRLTTYWSPNKLHDGCFNVLCKGFVQVDKRLFLGAPFSNISVLGGAQFHTFLAINQYVTTDYKNVDIDSNKVGEDIDIRKCYNVNYLDNFGTNQQTFTFGGPGGLCDV
ncbi:unnamed protein product [Arabis nemorensis]|uniref:Neprosin PEP catalytic domain-containing protein n=1 Tax=Arabis nemorensis TaxID=586526 RepID=A0A565C3I6_9BRAS|nr:unnamed protein product [Arabis nemorensis]